MEMDMQHQVMGYDRASTMFSPDGRILQVEYAEKTVRLGSASVGMICDDGVVIVSDRRLTDSLVVPESSVKIWEIDNNVMASAAGILSDARILIERAQVSAQQHHVVYDEESDVESIIKEIANTKQAYTQYGGARPFGIEIMVAGINLNDECKLYVSDVTVNYTGYYATSIGENDESIKEMLRHEWKKNLTVDQSIKLALTILKKVFGKGFNVSRFEAAFIRKDDRKVKRISGDALAKYLK